MIKVLHVHMVSVNLVCQFFSWKQQCFWMKFEHREHCTSHIPTLLDLLYFSNNFLINVFFLLIKNSPLCIALHTKGTLHVGVVSMEQDSSARHWCRQRQYRWDTCWIPPCVSSPTASAPSCHMVNTAGPTSPRPHHY